MSDKSEGLERVERMEKSTQTRGNSGPAWEKKMGPAAGGGTSGNPTSDGKIKRG
jgi:hypothetical protein